MGKRLEDLQLQEDPLPDVSGRRPHSAEADDFLDEITRLGGRARWAADTLSGIFDTVAQTGVVTVGQRRAIDNITAAADRRGDRPHRPRSTAWNGPPPVKPGHCRRCRRLLTDPESIRLGIGPECRAAEAAGE